MTTPETNDEQRKKKLSTTRPPLIHNETLMEIFDFSQVDLSSNRDGLLISSQREILHNDLKNDADAMWLMTMILLFAAVVVGLIMSLQGLPMVYLVVGAGVLLLPLLYFSYTRQTNARLDLEQTRIQSIQGRAEVIWSGGASRMRARLRVHDRHFNISIFQGKALEEYELPYLRVYYTQHSELLLSAEVVPMPSIDKLKVEDLDEDQDLLMGTGRQYNEEESRLS